MIKHIVMIKLNDKKDMEQLLEVFYSFKENIAEVRSLVHNINCYERDTNYDVIFTVEFDNTTDLETYIYCDYHQNAVNNVVKPLCSSLVTIDYV